MLVRRLFAGDAQKLELVESRFLAVRPLQSPLITLLNVANGQTASILVCISLID